MSNWNYRIIKKLNKDDRVYEIHEVYYHENGTIEGWTEDALHPMGESLAELKSEISCYIQAFRLPVLIEVSNEGKCELIEEKETTELNDGHYHEFLDRVFVAIDFFNNSVGAHPVARKIPEIRSSVEAVDNLMGELYVKAGGSFCRKN